MTEKTDEVLMAAYVAGDKGAFGELFRRYAPRLQRMLQRDLGRPQDASDLVQQTFLQLHRARADFRPDARLRPWIWTIALNLKRQYFRRIGRRPEAPLGEGDQTMAKAGDPEAAVAARGVRDALSRLPAAQRDVIALHWFEGLSFREVATMVGASEAAVKVRAHRGYAKLRQYLAESVTAGPVPAYPAKG